MGATCPVCCQEIRKPRATRKATLVEYPEIVPNPGREALYASWLEHRANGIKPAGIKGATKGARDGYNTRKRHADLYQWCADAFYAGMLYSFAVIDGDTWEIQRAECSRPERVTTTALYSMLPELARVPMLAAA